MHPQLSLECDVSDIEYASSSDNSFDDSDFEPTDYKIEFEEETLENFESCIADTNYANSVVLQTKYVILPILYLIFIISMLQIMLLKINIAINTIIIINIYNDPKTFYIAFIITLIITMIASILSMYGSYKWSFIALNDNKKSNNKHNIKQIINMKFDVLSYKKQIKFALNDVNKICYDNNDLELLSKQLFFHKQELIKFQENYQQKTGRKVFKNYIKEIDKQYQDIMQIINENELAILSTFLCKIKVPDSSINIAQSIDIRDYNNYLKQFNQTTIKEFNFFGGYHGMNKNKENTVDIKEFEKLIEKVIDLIDENSYTFLNY